MARPSSYPAELRERAVQMVLESRADYPSEFEAIRSIAGKLVERSFNLFENWRRLATRYDKLALTYRGAAVLAAIVIWLSHLGDAP